MLKNKVTEIKNKKELLNTIGDWNTILTTVNYEFGSNKITFKYNGQIVIFESDSLESPAFFAYQFHKISNKQYQNILMKGVK
ncbi:MAG TPA: hypothetical protein VK085_10695 [Pseudogracilibacillus sp.]|nr:hypothetical protein [Pseudogracilibacillus sp.]